MKTAIIIGSSRKDGDTQYCVDQLSAQTGWDVIDLSTYNISYYDYEHKNADDDYIPLMKRIVSTYDTLVFATPVYWYSMSGIMKVFIDRITDLLDIEQELGQKLIGKKLAVLSCSIGNHLGELFWLPFSETAKYLGMEYLGGVHIVKNGGVISEQEFAKMSRFTERIRKTSYAAFDL